MSVDSLVGSRFSFLTVKQLDKVVSIDHGHKMHKYSRVQNDNTKNNGVKSIIIFCCTYLIHYILLLIFIIILLN